jgi:hypothetical protein
VRPGIEADGKRVVAVRARAARLNQVESVPLGGANAAGPHVQLPRYHPVNDMFAIYPLADGDSILLLMQAPEGMGRAIGVRVTTRKIQ